MHEVHITVDVDWAPDWAMRRLMAALGDAGVRSTWFITHETEVLGELRQEPELFELGIHPNFQPGSSHGSSAADVVAECMRIVPEALTMRTHCLVQSTPMLQAVCDASPILLDSSIYLRDAVGVTPSMLPLDRGGSLTRVPYVWEDDLEFFAAGPRWDGQAFVESRHGDDEITIIDVHPIHFVLNSASVDDYRGLKDAFGDTRVVDERTVIEYAHDGAGTATFISSLVALGSRDDLAFDRPLVALHSRATEGALR